MQSHVEDAVSAADDQLVAQLIRESKTRRPVTVLVDVHLVYHFARTRPENGTARIEVEPQRSADTIDVLRGEVVVVAETEVHGQSRRRPPVVLHVEPGAPLTDSADRNALGRARRPRKAHHEGCRSVAGDIAGEVERAERCVRARRVAPHTPDVAPILKGGGGRVAPRMREVVDSW